MRGPEFSGAPRKIPAPRRPVGRGGAEYSDPRAGPRTFQGPVFPPAFTVPTVFFATGAYFWGQISVYHTPNHAFIADKHDPAYYQRLIDLGSKHRSRKIRSAPEIRAGPHRGAPCGASPVVPCPVPMRGPARPGVGRGLIYVPRFALCVQLLYYDLCYGVVMFVCT